MKFSTDRGIFVFNARQNVYASIVAALALAIAALCVGQHPKWIEEGYLAAFFKKDNDAKHPSQTVFSEFPQDEEFLRQGKLTHPLVPASGTSLRENQDLAQALISYEALVTKTNARDAVQPITDFLEKHPQSAWRPAILLNLGVIYRQTGHFTAALSTLREAWATTKSLETPSGRALGDASVAALSQFEAYLGRKETLLPLLDDVKSRPLRGASAEVVNQSHLGLTHMLQVPERSFRCGPLALARILTFTKPKLSVAEMTALENANSTPNG